MSSFIEQCLVFIGSAILLVPLFQRLRLGSVLGYLVAGTVVGPYGLKWIHDSESVAHFSELGVVFLLFMIGLEIQPRKLWSMRKHLLGLGGAQVVLCSLVFTLIGWAMGLGFLSASIVGFALSLSSTAFAVQYLTEKNLFNTEFGRASFAILLFQDLAAIPALAIIPAIAATTSTGPSLRNVGLAVLIVLALVLMSRFLMRPVFRIIAETRSRDIFTAVTLFIVLGVAALMQSVGLSAALGSFIAGVLLSDSEYRHELEADLEPFKGMLMGLFFIAVGLGVRLDLIVERWWVVLLLSVGYMLLKCVIIYVIGKWFDLNSQNSKRMSLAVAQGGEFAFVIFGIVMQMGVVPSDTLALLTAMITVSMALSPLANLAEDYLSRRMQKLIEPEYDQIDGETPEVIIAGFGRFGQIFGRILRAQEIPFVAVDHDSNQIDLVRRFGSKVYFGDASRKEIIEAAGGQNAKYFILAIDDIELSLKAAQTVKEHFPHLKIFARARNRGHAFDLMDVGVHALKRETLDSSVYFVRDLLVTMGFAAHKALRMVEKFRIHDEIMLMEQYKVRKDSASMLSVSKQGAEQLAQVLRDDSMQSHIAPEVPSKPVDPKPII